jgi:hypothetical protein
MIRQDFQKSYLGFEFSHDPENANDSHEQHRRVS